MKMWKKPELEHITRDELEDMITASGCSSYGFICQQGYRW